MRIDPIGLIVITILLANAAHLDAASYFVNYTEGGDGNDGRSQTQAWKHCPGDPAATGQAAQAELAPGDTVFFKGGVSYVFTGDSGIELKWSGGPNRAITYDGNRSGHWGSGRARFTDNQGNKAIAAFSAGDLRHDLVFSFLD
ncbi:MAG: hypothetical protein ABIQ12_10785, partial [Opitutaceae bacterium]